jgi:hypothetical protein
LPLESLVAETPFAVRVAPEIGCWVKALTTLPTIVALVQMGIKLTLIVVVWSAETVP